MAGLAKLTWVVSRRSTGKPIQGATVEVRKQGAQVNGAHPGSVTSFTVNEPGATIFDDVVAINATSSPTRAVSSIALTNVTVSAPGFDDAADDDRITIASPLPTIYGDSQGNETKVNPLTTDINGMVECFIVGGKYDLIVTADGARTIYIDIATVGGESMRSNIYSGTAWKMDSLRTLAVDDIALDVSSAGVNKFKVMGDGEIQAGAAGATHALTGNTTITGTLTSSGALTVQAGDLNVTAGTSVAAALALANFKRIGATGGTAVVAGDFALSGLWGTTASITNIRTGSNDTRGRIQITSSGTGQGPGGAAVILTFKDGTYTVAPFAVVCGGDATTPAVTDDKWRVSTSATTATFNFYGTPVAGNAYEFSYIVVK